MFPAVALGPNLAGVGSFANQDARGMPRQVLRERTATILSEPPAAAEISLPHVAARATGSSSLRRDQVVEFRQHLLPDIATLRADSVSGINAWLALFRICRSRFPPRNLGKIQLLQNRNLPLEANQNFRVYATDAL
jgi:hypothetical protein